MTIKFRFINQIVGGFILLSIFIVIVSSYFIIKEKRIFVKMRKFYTLLDRGDGISPNTQVKLKGINIGNVYDIYMNDEGKIVVQFQIFPEYAKYIKGFTYIKIASGSFLGGKSLELIPSDIGLMVPDGAYIPYEGSKEVQNLIARGEIKTHKDDMNAKIKAILSDVNVITKNIKVLTAKINDPKDHIQKMLGNLQNITSNIAQLTEMMKQSSPDIKKMIIDTQATIEDTHQIVKTVRREGALSIISSTEKPINKSKSIVTTDTRD